MRAIRKSSSSKILFLLPIYVFLSLSLLFKVFGWLLFLYRFLVYLVSPFALGTCGCVRECVSVSKGPGKPSKPRKRKSKLWAQPKKKGAHLNGQPLRVLVCVFCTVRFPSSWIVNINEKKKKKPSIWFPAQRERILLRCGITLPTGGAAYLSLLLYDLFFHSVSLSLGWIWVVRIIATHGKKGNRSIHIHQTHCASGMHACRMDISYGI